MLSGRSCPSRSSHPSSDGLTAGLIAAIIIALNMKLLFHLATG